MLNRRSVVAGLSLSAIAAPSLVRGAEPLTLWGPPAAPSLVLAVAVQNGLLRDIAPSASFKSWRSPDEMRAGLASGTMEAVVVPTYAALNLHNRGLGIRLANVLTDGLLYLVAPAGTVRGPADLKGKKVSVSLRNEMPDFIFRRVLAAAKVAPADLTIDYSGSPAEVGQLLVSGQLDAALMSEPACTAVITRAGMAGKPLERAIDTRKAWAAITGRGAIPQAGLAATDKLTARIGADGLAAIQSALAKALDTIRQDPGAAARAVAGTIDMPAPVLERSIPHSSLVVRPASEAKDDLVALFKVLAESDPRIIGGKLPEARFYAL
ncbi:ABC transporter substrate-binding protein [Enterovirga rhinocerotis]|uniref:NitT/TauT family transport system substrate-binding protein n=1 Tax=Enterovirga rhinocerotis TaxID=1339210 RepID=A0A4R7BJK9_9HYPH|nr:ABC transporter substrate-binding protein [Enterovirga rhinocerotis]TDR85361.1 NitT/TauT family transport system substrate-binding protein [Enterovirga rhinocerotis]